MPSADSRLKKGLARPTKTDSRQIIEAAAEPAAWGDGRAVPSLKELLLAARPDVRKAAALALAGQGQPDWRLWIQGDDLDFIRIAKSADLDALEKLKDVLDKAGLDVRRTVEKSVASALPEARGEKPFDAFRRLVKRNLVKVAQIHAADKDHRAAQLLKELLGEPDGEFLKKDLERAALLDIDLRNMSLAGADLRFAYLNGARLSGADLAGANLQGAHLKEALLNSANMRGADFWQAELKDAYLNQSDCGKANFKQAYLFGANLSAADLGKAVLYRASLTQASLEQVRLCEADLTEALLQWVRAAGADIRESCLRNADATGADLSRSILHRCDLSGAVFFSANFAGAVIADCRLSGATLDHAYLEGTVLALLDLRDVGGLSPQQLAKADCLYEVKLPDALESDLRRDHPRLFRPFDVSALMNKK